MVFTLQKEEALIFFLWEISFFQMPEYHVFCGSIQMIHKEESA